MNKVRILVVDDSPTVRGFIVDALRTDPGIEVIAEADDGKRAIELCQELRPDVITLDMVLPVMSGLAATEYIMAHCPTPILIVSASTNRGELFKTYEALAAGAVDVLDKPTGEEPERAWEQRLVATAKLVARIKVIRRARSRTVQTVSPAADSVRAASDARRFSVVGIGASTGGPAALLEVLRGMPTDFRLPILIVMHIGEPFGASFADWLDGVVPQPVAYAREGMVLSTLAGRVLMAPPGQHLAVRAGRLLLTRDPERYSCRPSVDVLFESLARECGSTTAACLLTGMGRDGASGLLDVRRAGGYTIAQDEASCVVYGMPREAANLGAAERVLPLREIASALARLAVRRPGDPP